MDPIVAAKDYKGLVPNCGKAVALVPGFRPWLQCLLGGRGSATTRPSPVPSATTIYMPVRRGIERPAEQADDHALVCDWETLSHARFGKPFAPLNGTRK